MKQLFVSLILMATLAATAQTKPPAKKPATAKPATAAVLKNQLDSVSYAVGLMALNFSKQQGITKLNSAFVAKAINDAMTGKALLADEAANEVMTRCITQAQQAKSAPNLKKGEAFLAANKTKAGVKTTASGLQYEVLTQGTGPMPTASDTVVCNYRGTLLDGTEFDNSYKRGEPITFPLSNVIRGWTEGLQLMPVGSKYKFYVPQDLGYGTNDMGAIPAGSALIFEVELLSIKGKTNN